MNWKRLVDLAFGSDVWLRRLYMICMCLLTLCMFVMCIGWLLNWLLNGHPLFNCGAPHA